MKLLKLTANQLKKIGVLEDQLTAISNASQKYDRAEWVKKKDELSRECHCTDDVNAAIEAADAYGMHVADAARAEAYRDISGLMLSALHNKIQQDVTCPLLQPILGEAAVAVLEPRARDGDPAPQLGLELGGGGVHAEMGIYRRSLVANYALLSCIVLIEIH